MVETPTFVPSIPPIYKVVYSKPMKVRPKLKEDLNTFLSYWLRNLASQGHGLVLPETAKTSET